MAQPYKSSNCQMQFSAKPQRKKYTKDEVICAPSRMPTCAVLRKRDSAAMMCAVCLARCHGSTVREKCHRNRPCCSCDCPICLPQREANDAPREEPKEERSTRSLAHVDYKADTRSFSSGSTDIFFVGKSKLDAHFKVDTKNKMKWALQASARQQAKEQQSPGKGTSEKQSRAEKDEDNDPSNQAEQEGLWKPLHLDMDALHSMTTF
jgi:hypothetical protein